MNRYKAVLNTGTTTEDMQYTYNVYVNNTVIYTGKAFKLASQGTITIDLTDILADYQYAGYGMLKPEWRDGMYQQPAISEVSLSSSPSVEKGLHFETVIIRLYNGNTQVTSTSITPYFHTIPFEGESNQKNINSNLCYNFGNIIPNLPKMNTKYLRFAQLVCSTSARQPVWTNGTSTVMSFSNASGSRVIGTDLVTLVGLIGSSNDLYSNGYHIAHFDECVDDNAYYLAWVSDNGGMQCQRFRANSTYTEEESRNMKISTDDMNDIANTTIKGKWKLKSENLTDAEYREYMAITRSPYLFLYIPRLDKGIFVNVSDTSMEQKKYITNSKKFPYFEVNVETREQLTSIN